MNVDPECGFTARLVYTGPMRRRAFTAFMVRRLPLGTIAMTAICAIGASVLYCLGLRGISLAIAIAVPLMFAISSIAVWLRRSADTIGPFRATNTAEAELIATRDGATFRSSLGSVTLPWREFTDVWDLGDCWMMFTGPARFSILPTDTLNASARAFLRSRLPGFAPLHPDRLVGHTTRPEAVAIARRAAGEAYPGSMMADAMGWARLAHVGDRLVWSVSSQTIGSQLVVRIDDRTGDVLSTDRQGLR